MRVTEVILDITVNDYDPEGTYLDMTIMNWPTSGTSSDNGNGTINYAPNPGFTGSEVFNYYVCDQGTPTLCDTSTITVIVAVFNNDPPIAQDDYDTLIVNQNIVVDVTNNDFDEEYGDLSVTIGGGLTMPGNGSILIYGGNKIEYTPNPQYTGDDFFQYQVCDDEVPALCDIATVYIHVLNRPPDAKNDIHITQTNVPLDIDVMFNDLNLMVTTYG